MSIQSRLTDLLRVEETIRKAMGDLFSRLDESNRRLDESNRRRDQADRRCDHTLKELQNDFVSLKDQRFELTAKLTAVNRGDSSPASIEVNARAQCFATCQSKVGYPKFIVNDLHGSGTCAVAPNLLQSTASTPPENLQKRDKSVEESIAHFSAEVSNFIGRQTPELQQANSGHYFSKPLAELRSLKQLGMVSDYLNQFKTLLEKVEMDESYAVHLFVSGLNYHIQKVRMSRPKSLVHTFALARLQESSLNFRGIYYADLEVKDEMCMAEIETEMVMKLKVEEFSSECSYENVEVMETVWLEQTEMGMVMNLKEKESSLEGSFELMNSTSFAAQEMETKFPSLKFKEELHLIAAPEDGLLKDTQGSIRDMNTMVPDAIYTAPTVLHKRIEEPRHRTARILQVAREHFYKTERCMLYSMRMFGNDIDSLRFASGTIFNKVVGLEVICRNGDKHSRIHVEDHLQLQGDESRSRLVERGKRNFKHKLVKQELISQVVCLAPPLCLVTKFMSSGRVFDDLQNRKSILKLPGTLKTTIDVLVGMSYLHQNTIIHRGLKVSNLLRDDNQVLMTVFTAIFYVAQVLVQLGNITAEAEIWQGIASEVFSLYNHKNNVFIYEVMLWMLLTKKSPYAHNWEQHPIIVEEHIHDTERVLQISEELELEVKVYSGLRIMQVKPVRMPVADWNSWSCDSLCRGVIWSLQNNFFTTYVLLFLLENCDMVYGFQWLENLGTIQWDFKNLSMELSYQGKTHVLRGCAQAVKDEQQLQLHSLDCSGSNMIVDDDVALLLEGHEVFFKEPTSLPPFRDHNHQILLKEGTQDIASRSVQKDVIEKDVLSRVHTSDIVISLGRRKGGSMLQDSFEVFEVVVQSWAKEACSSSSWRPFSNSVIA